MSVNFNSNVKSGAINQKDKLSVGKRVGGYLAGGYSV